MSLQASLRRWIVGAIIVVALSSPMGAWAALVGMEGGTPVITGHLLLADGTTPAAGWTVAVQTGVIPAEDAAMAAWPAIYAGGAIGDYTQADVADDGSFTLRGLSAGPHALDVRQPGKRRAWCSFPDVAVSEDGITDLGVLCVPDEGWEYLFDGAKLGDWADADFYGKGEVVIEEDAIVLTDGNDMTGVAWQGDLPTTDYEISLQARRVEGADFFCGMTFPVDDACCSLILGGWGGSIVGISSLDWMDASENETGRSITFETGRWYRVRLRVSGGHIEAWLDAKQIIDVETEGRNVSTRWEMSKCEPFGFATWNTTGALRDIRRRSTIGD